MAALARGCRLGARERDADNDACGDSREWCWQAGRPVHSVIIDNTDSTYGVEFTSFRAGNSTLFAHQLLRGGVAATYYDAPDLTLPKSARRASQGAGGGSLQKIGWQSMSQTAGLPGTSIATTDGYSVRWTGFLAPTQDGEYSFQMTRSGSIVSDRVRVWVDNWSVIDQWASLSALNPKGTIFLRAFSYYDVWVDYKVEGSAVSPHFAQLYWKSGSSTLAAIPSGSLFEGYAVHGSPFNVRVHPSWTCASTSIASPDFPDIGNSLELATAGLQAEFTITAKDSYGNLKGTGGEDFLVRLTGVDTTSGVVEVLATICIGMISVRFDVNHVAG